eukprot:scaffold53688_cov57-Phaeocystis_antarctica.AAC.1
MACAYVVGGAHLLEAGSHLFLSQQAGAELGQQPLQQVVSHAQQVGRRRQRRLGVLVLGDERGPLELPADETVGRDAAVGVGHLRDEQVDEDDGRDELVDPQQDGHEGRRRLELLHEQAAVGRYSLLQCHGAADVEAAKDPPEGSPQRVVAHDAVPRLVHRVG